MQRLEESRNLAWEAYQTLLIKQAEAQIAAQTLGTEVRFASPAIQPQRPIGKQMVLKLVVAVGISFGLSVFAIVAWEWWSSRFHAISNEIES
jgi:uncharacterized protein involved in exopolysaccharide biosynthesis